MRLDEEHAFARFARLCIESHAAAEFELDRNNGEQVGPRSETRSFGIRSRYHLILSNLFKMSRDHTVGRGVR